MMSCVYSACEQLRLGAAKANPKWLEGGAMGCDSSSAHDYLPSSNDQRSYGKSLCLMDKSTVNDDFP